MTTYTFCVLCTFHRVPGIMFILVVWNIAVCN